MSQRSSDSEEESEGEGDAAAVSVHPSHAMLYLHPEIDIAEAASIVLEVSLNHLAFLTSIIPYGLI